MSIFIIDNTEDKLDMIDAIDRDYARERNPASMKLLLDDLDDALENVTIDRLQFRTQVQKLVMANNHERAKKLVAVLNDHDLRLWALVFFRLLFLPIVLPYKIWKWLIR